MIGSTDRVIFIIKIIITIYEKLGATNSHYVLSRYVVDRQRNFAEQVGVDANSFVVQCPLMKIITRIFYHVGI